MDGNIILEPRSTVTANQTSSYDQLSELNVINDAALLTQNHIIEGDNNQVIKNHGDVLTEKVECIYIDPPYNNKEVYNHYTDMGCENEWLTSIGKHISLLHPLLSNTGSIWISIDDSQMHYLKVKCDEIFGRKNFITTIIWEHRNTRENRNVFSNNHEYILVYAKDALAFKSRRNLLPLNDKVLSRYKNPDGDKRGVWQSVSANVQAGHGVPSQFYDIIAPSGKVHSPPKGRCWAYSQKRMNAEIEMNNVWFGGSGDGVPRIKKFLKEAKSGLTPQTLWRADEVGTTSKAKKHVNSLFPQLEVFDTPKPEKLIHRILEIATDPGDLVLDTFLGSGTTAAVAHVSKRRYIGIELGGHASSFCAARIDKLIKNVPSATSLDLSWSGGGNYNYTKVKTSK